MAVSFSHARQGRRDKWAIRFMFAATGASGQAISVEVNYFYHLKEGKISEFWLLADFDFDYRADD
jgi:hypothetical protein